MRKANQLSLSQDYHSQSEQNVRRQDNIDKFFEEWELGWEDGSEYLLTRYCHSNGWNPNKPWATNEDEFHFAEIFKPGNEKNGGV